MGAKAYRPPAPDKVPAVSTDGLEDVAQRRAREELLPMAAKRNRNAIQVIPHRFEVYQRLHEGRRCSCFTMENDPSSSCRVCCGTGVPGGFSKRGTIRHMLDVTHPNVWLSNTKVDYDNPTRPIFYTLQSTALYGDIEWEVELQPNLGILDVWGVEYHAPPGSTVASYVKAPYETKWTLAKPKVVRERLGASKLSFRIVLERTSTKAPSPKVVCAHFGYKTLAVSAVPMDVPLNTYSIVMEEYGITNTFTSQVFQADNTVRKFNPETMLYDVEQGLRWKVIQVTGNDPFGVLVGSVLEVRVIQPWETNYQSIPLGDVPALQDGTFMMNSREVLEQQQARQGTFQQPMGKPIQGGRLPVQMDQANPVNTSGLPPGSMDISLNPDTVRRR